MSIQKPGRKPTGETVTLSRIMAVALLATSVSVFAGCAGRNLKNDPVVNVGSVPDPKEQCEPAMGTKPSNPVESGMRMSVFASEGRLVCPGGAVAVLTSRTTMPEQKVFTDAVKMAEGDDVIEEFRFQCPEREVLMFANVRREGKNCIPAPFTMIPSEAARYNVAAVRELTAGNFKKGLELARKAVDAFPQADILLHTLGTAWMTVGDFRNAEKVLSKAVECNPKSVIIRLARAIALSELGDKDSYAAEIEKLFMEVPENDPLHWDLMCRKADNLNRLGKRNEAVPIAKTACEHGAQICCDLGTGNVVIEQ